MIVGTLHKLHFETTFYEPPLHICIHHHIQWKLCFYIRAKCYDQNWLPWSILPIFSEKEHIVVFKMNWIYAVVLLKATHGAIAILEPIQTDSDGFKLGDFQFPAVSNSLHLPYTIHQDDKWKRIHEQSDLNKILCQWQSACLIIVARNREQSNGSNGYLGWNGVKHNYNHPPQSGACICDYR